MLVTEFSTESVAAPERFDLFVEAADRSRMTSLLRSDDRDDFRARMRVVELGDVQLSTLAFPHLEIVRTAKLVRQSDPEVYLVNYLLGREGSVSLDGGDTLLRAGDLVALDSSRLYHAHYAHQDSWSQVTVRFPRRLLPLPEKTVRRALAVPMSGRDGMGGVLTRWLTDIDARADELTPADIPTLTSVTLDLLASVIARCQDSEGALSPEARRRALQARIRDFVRRELGNPGLTPDVVAAAHGISSRYLYKLFHEQGLTVAGWIRECRLERCRRDLGDPRLSSLSVQAVASRWGFTDKAHFSRAFRAAYGTSPRDYRHSGAREPRARTVNQSAGTVNDTPETR